MDEVTYRRILKAPERALNQMLLDFRFFREDVPGLLVFAEESRLKTFESALNKSKQSGIPIQDLQDLAAARIVVGTSQEVELVRRFFTRQQDSNDLVVETDRPISHDTGYRSHHVVVRYPPSYTRSASPALIEVQIPTVFQHAFNNLSRAWVYKSKDSISPTWQEKFRDLSKQLDALNAAASMLYSDVVESAKGTDPNAPLTPFSLQLIVKSEFGESVEMDEAVDAVRFLSDWTRITSNGAFKSFLKNDSLEALWQQFRRLCDAGVEEALKLSQSRWDFYMLWFRAPDLGRKFLTDLQERNSKES